MNDLLSKAKEQFELYKEYTKLANEAYKLYKKYTDEHGEENAPFKVGDIIEYQTLQGFAPKKLVTKRMLVKHISFDGNLQVDGQLANAKGQVNYRNSDFAIFGDGYSSFSKVLKQKESK